MKKRIYIFLGITLLLIAAYYLLNESLTTYYHHTHKKELEIVVSSTQDVGLGQAYGYDVTFAFENKKTGASTSFNDANERFWYELYVENITIHHQKRKTIVIHDLGYGHFVFIDYRTLKQRCEPLFDFSGGTVIDSTDLIIQGLKNARPIWTIGRNWMEH